MLVEWVKQSESQAKIEIFINKSFLLLLAINSLFPIKLLHLSGSFKKTGNIFYTLMYIFYIFNV